MPPFAAASLHSVSSEDEMVTEPSSPLSSSSCPCAPRPRPPQKRVKLDLQRNQVCPVASRHEFNASDIHAAWYNAAEFSKMKADCMQILNRLNAGETIAETTEQTSRGLRLYKHDQYVHREAGKHRLRQAVLAEQVRQRFAHDGIYDDVNMWRAAVAQGSSVAALRAAWERAQEDYDVVYNHKMLMQYTDADIDEMLEDEDDGEEEDYLQEVFPDETEVEDDYDFDCCDDYDYDMEAQHQYQHHHHQTTMSIQRPQRPQQQHLPVVEDFSESEHSDHGLMVRSTRPILTIFCGDLLNNMRLFKQQQWR